MAHETAVYTHGHHDSVLRSHRWRTAVNSAGYLLDRLRPDHRVLDIGCGPGTITADLAALVPQGSVTGLDAAAGVLEQARATAAERGVTNAEFTTGDVHALRFADGSFDVVHAHQTLQHVGDPVGALREMRRVCAPGGVAAVRDADYGGMFWYPEVPGMDDWLDLYRRVAEANGGVPDAGRRLHAWARQAGFTDVTVSTGTWCFSTPEERAWWSGLWAERTMASHFAAVAVDGGLATHDDLRRISEAWRAWGEQEDGWFTVVHGELLCHV
ncbi:methyltransferase domain-containing protein [Streptomyces sp. 891-h]|uniref:methyltransferase domain-containing protein n=1 Tax=Streptomyces sp. 891-h TaxID=2720714 RepID=UPI001FA9AAE7|nr:methyltransferase domain-containing protein [Streptomyces sp. 891-h]UNZ16730.1 methyltransferase domain-containing protein [Streptomyces sp. 891-h]